MPRSRSMPGGQRRQTVREGRRHRRDMDARAPNRLHGGGDEGMVDADRGRPDDFRAEPVDAFEAEPSTMSPRSGFRALAHRRRTRSSVSLRVQRRQIHAARWREAAMPPASSPLMERRLVRLPTRRSSARAVDVAHRFQEAEVERHAGIADSDRRRRVGSRAHGDRACRCAYLFQVGHSLAAHSCRSHDEAAVIMPGAACPFYLPFLADSKAESTDCRAEARGRRAGQSAPHTRPSSASVALVRYLSRGGQGRVRQCGSNEKLETERPAGSAPFPEPSA